jgi:hypothetical protein
MRWNTPEMVEIKMDAEISSYQDDNYDPMRDGPLFVKIEKPAETKSAGCGSPRAQVHAAQEFCGAP